MHVPFMWQTKFYIQHDLTCISCALAAASSSSLESIFGCIQKPTATIDTLPKEGIKIQCLLHPFTADNYKIFLKKITQDSLQIHFHYSFQTLDWMLQFLLDIQKSSIRQIFNTPPAICRYTCYINKSVEERIFIPIFIVISGYKEFEFVWNMSSITVELSKVGFRVLDVPGLNLHNQTGYMNWW